MGSGVRDVLPHRRLELLEVGVSNPRDRDRDLDRERDQAAREEEDERRAETERRSEELWKAWRDRRPVREDDEGRPKKKRPS